MKMRFAVAVFFVAKITDQFHKAIVPMSYINPVDVSFASVPSFAGYCQATVREGGSVAPTRVSPSRFLVYNPKTPQINIVPAYEQKGRSSPQY